MRSQPSGPGDALSRTRLPSTRLAPSRARSFVQSVIAEHALSTDSAGPRTDRLTDDASLLVSELITNAFLHAGTDTEVTCTFERPAGTEQGALPGLLIEVTDGQPSGTVPGEAATRRGGHGVGLQLVDALAESWGVTYRRTEKTVWFRLTASEDAADAAGPDYEAPFQHGLQTGEMVTSLAQADHGGAILAEAGELLSGQFDEDMVAALADQLLVPRLADWCAVWLSTGNGTMRLSRVWHTDEQRLDALRRSLEPDPPPFTLRTAGTPWPWPAAAAGRPGQGGSALAFSLVSNHSCQGTLIIGRATPPEITDSTVRTVEDVARRVAQAVHTARQYTRQTTISRALQRRQLPPSLPSPPGVESAIVYEPHGPGDGGQTVGGDFYDLFPVGGNRWCFLLGDVQGKDPEAMSATGLTRHLVRLLAREGHGVESVLGRLNSVLAEEGAEAVAVWGESAQPRFLSLVYGELEPDTEQGGAHCLLASAGHPPPLRLSGKGAVTSTVVPQMLLGIDEGAEFTAETVDLAPGETLLCVTDGVTERRNGKRQLDDDDGLAVILQGCAGLGAMAVAERVRQSAHDFGPGPVDDDLAVLVLHAATAYSPRQAP